jgi:uncharacterized protein (DUF1800 family)
MLSGFLVLALGLSISGASAREDASLEEKRAALLLSRATYGPRPGDYERILAMGTEAWLEEQLRPERIDDSELEEKLERFPDLMLSTRELMEKYPRPSRAQREAMQKAQQELEQKRAEAEAAGKEVDPRVLMHEMARMGLTKQDRPGQVLATLSQAKLLRAVESERQLQEVLTDFWFNHFNVYARKSLPTLLNLPSYERDAIRPNVLGHFYELLLATAQHPAMLRYLDNWINTKENFDPRAEIRQEMLRGNLRTSRRRMGSRQPQQRDRRFGLNENYARELLELHTMGVDGGYTQDDVVEVARCLTGWTSISPELLVRQIQERLRGRRSSEDEELPRIPPEDGRFHFNARAHDEGSKKVLGKTIEAGGLDDGLEVLRMLSTHPSTARLISKKLAQRFVSDTPSEALVHEMSKTFLQSSGDITEVLETMFLSPRFVEEGYATVKVRTPLELVASSLRATSAGVTGPAISWSLVALGMPLYMCQPPTGYDEDAETWLSAGNLLNRVRFVGGLLSGKIPGIALPRPPQDIESWVEAVLPLRNQRLSAEDKVALMEALAEYPALARSQELQSMALVLTSPAFQRQ